MGCFGVEWVEISTRTGIAAYLGRYGWKLIFFERNLWAWYPEIGDIDHPIHVWIGIPYVSDKLKLLLVVVVVVVVVWDTRHWELSAMSRPQLFGDVEPGIRYCIHINSFPKIDLDRKKNFGHVWKLSVFFTHGPWRFFRSIWIHVFQSLMISAHRIVINDRPEPEACDDRLHPIESAGTERQGAGGPVGRPWWSLGGLEGWG